MHAALSAGAAAAGDDAVWLALALHRSDGVVGSVRGATVLAAHTCAVPGGLGDALPLGVRALLAQFPTVAAIACVVGPGPFTGLRAALALAHGVAIGRDLPLVGVTVDEVEAATGTAAAPFDGLVPVVAAARARRAGTLPPLAPLPFYAEPPGVTAPATPDRPPPLRP